MGIGEHLASKTFKLITVKMAFGGGAETSVAINSIRTRLNSLARNTDFNRLDAGREGLRLQLNYIWTGSVLSLIHISLYFGKSFNEDGAILFYIFIVRKKLVLRFKL